MLQLICGETLSADSMAHSADSMVCFTANLGVAAMAGLDFSVHESLFLIGRSEAGPNAKAGPILLARPCYLCVLK